MKKQSEEKVALYQSTNGALQLKTDIQQDTIWASLMQIAALFDTDKSGISRHINNIYKSGELPQKGTVAKFTTVQKEGNREVARKSMVGSSPDIRHLGQLKADLLFCPLSRLNPLAL